MNWARDRAVGWVLSVSVFVTGAVRWCHGVAIAIVRLWRGVVRWVRAFFFFPRRRRSWCWGNGRGVLFRSFGGWAGL
jgi:hypothetical protein